MAEIGFHQMLAEAVEKRPCLYNYHMKEYSNRERVQSAWEEVAKEVNNSIKECKDTWRNMRIVFLRNIKKPTDISNAKKKSWPLLHSMMFLKSFVTVKRPTTNLPSPPQSDINDDGTSVVGDIHQVDDYNLGERGMNESFEDTEPMGSPPKKKKTCQSTTIDDVVVDYIRSKTDALKDTPRKLFLMSLLPEVENMTTHQFKIFRRDILNLIDLITEP